MTFTLSVIKITVNKTRYIKTFKCLDHHESEYMMTDFFFYFPCAAVHYLLFVLINKTHVLGVIVMGVRFADIETALL